MIGQVELPASQGVFYLSEGIDWERMDHSSWNGDLSEDSDEARYI